MRLWHRETQKSAMVAAPAEDTGQRRMEIVHAQRRLDEVEKRVEAASSAILSRHDRNHWTETFKKIAAKEA